MLTNAAFVWSKKYSTVILWQLEWFLKDRVTEDWSNDTENLALHHKNKLHFKIY